MKRTFWVILVFLVLAGLVMLMETVADRPVDWKPSYAKNNLQPYGTYLVFQGLKDIFPEQNIQVNYQNMYDFLSNLEAEQTNFIFITRDFELDDYSWNLLQNRVENGSTVFISAETFSDNIEEDLGFEMGMYFTALPNDSLSLNFTNRTLKTQKGYPFLNNSVTFYFYPKEGKKLAINTQNEPVLMKIAVGKGNFILSSTPNAFTNLTMTIDNEQFIADAFSYMPVQKTVWDEYFKMNKKESQSLLKEFMKEESFRWAIYLSMIVLLVFIIFQGKRKQKFIPIIESVKNTSLEFTETIGRLYYQHRNHKNIADKKITYFLDYIRQYFYIKTQKLDANFTKQLSEKSGVAFTQIQTLVGLIIDVQNNEFADKNALLALNKSIQDFKKQQKVVSNL